MIVVISVTDNVIEGAAGRAVPEHGCHVRPRRTGGAGLTTMMSRPVMM